MDREPATADWDYEAELDDLLDFLGELTVDDTRAMAAAWAEIDPAERTSAWALVRSETKAARRDRALDEARETVARWAAGSSHSLEGSPYSVSYGQDLDKRDTRVQAAAPVLDAAAAVIVRDLLPADAFDVLYGPWAVATAPLDEELELVDGPLLDDEDDRDDGDDRDGDEDRDGDGDGDDDDADDEGGEEQPPAAL